MGVQALFVELVPHIHFIIIHLDEKFGEVPMVVLAGDPVETIWLPAS
jgi:hypothetical protein